MWIEILVKRKNAKERRAKLAIVHKAVSERIEKNPHLKQLLIKEIYGELSSTPDPVVRIIHRAREKKRARRLFKLLEILTESCGVSVQLLKVEKFSAGKATL